MIGVCWVLLAPQAGAADHFAADDDFVREAQRAGSREVADAQSALTLSNNPNVKQAAQMMLSDGTTVNRRLAEIAVEEGWIPASPEPAADGSDYSDYTYIIGQIAAQRRAIDVYEQEAANGADTTLREFAKKTVPAMRRTLESLRALRSA
jgi:putative membrane protein